MRWLVSMFDRVAGTAVGTAAALAASQTQAFIGAYLQRLGGHLDEARRSLAHLQSGQFLPGLDAISHDRMAEAFSRRVEELETAYRAVADAGVFQRPFQFARHFDRDIAEATFAAFTPALPLNTASLVYILTGIVLGLLLYELVKLPFRLALRPWRHA